MKNMPSILRTKLLTTLMLFGLSTASIAGNVALNKPATQTSTINGGNANLAVDNNTATIAQTSNAPGQSWQVDLGGRYRDAKIAIFGKSGAIAGTGTWRNIYGTSKVHFLLGATVVQTESVVNQKSSVGPNTPDAALSISSKPNIIFDSVKVENASGTGLYLREVQIDAQPYVDNRPNVALGKPTFQTSTLEGQGTSDIAVDGNENWFTHTLNGPSEYWKVDLLFPYKISTISIANRRDCCARRILGATVQILSGGAVAYTHVINENDFASDPYLELTVPAGTAGDSVRVLNKPNEYLSLAEVRVNGVYSYPFPADGAPGAVMTFKSGEFKGQPGLSNGGLPSSAYAMIKGVNDAVNVSPPLAGYGAATITDSASVQNQTLVPNGKNENIAEISTFAFGLAQPTRIKFRAGLDTGKASSLVIDGVPRTLQMYGQWWEGNWGKLNDIGWTEFVDLPAGNHTFQVYGVENCCSSPQSFQYQVAGGQWTNFSANDPALAVRPFGDVFFTPNDQTYRSLGTFTLPPKATGGYETLMFKVRASNDAHIKLGCTSNTNVFYEIVLGGWGNTRSVMRPVNNNNDSIGNDGAALNTPNLLNGNEERDFWIATDGATNTIRVGRGTDPTQGQFMSWANPPSFPWTGSNRAPLCFQFRTGWGSTGTWSGIRNTKTSMQKNIDDYSSFLAAFPPPPGAGPLFDPNWMKQQWTSSNQDTETFRQKLRDQAKNEVTTQETFPDSTTTLSDVLDAFDYLSNSNITQLFPPDYLTYIKKLALPHSLENNLLTGAINRTIVINTTPIPIYAPGTLNQGLDSYTSSTATSQISSNGVITTPSTTDPDDTALVGSFQSNSEFSVAVQSNVVIPTKNANELPFDINLAFGIPLFSISSASYQHQGETKHALDSNIVPMKMSLGLVVDGLDYLDPVRQDYFKKIMGVSLGGAAKFQTALYCDKQRFGACQVQNIKIFAQLKGGVEVLKVLQTGYKTIEKAVGFFGVPAYQLLSILTPRLVPFLSVPTSKIDIEVSNTLAGENLQLGDSVGDSLGSLLTSGAKSGTLAGTTTSDGKLSETRAAEYVEKQQQASSGDPTGDQVSRNYTGMQNADPAVNQSTSSKAAKAFKTFCDSRGTAYRLECTNDVKLDLSVGIQWSNSYALDPDEFITGYNLHVAPDAVKAAITMRLTPGWEARLDDTATFKLRIIPTWTHSFLYVPLTTLGVRASPVMTSEDD